MREETALKGPAIFYFRVLAPIISLLPVLHFFLLRIFYVPIDVNEIQLIILIILSTTLADLGLHYDLLELKALSGLSFFKSITSIITTILFVLSYTEISKNLLFSANLALISITLLYYHALDSEHKAWRSKFTIVKVILCAFILSV